ncbi:MAG: type II secretion system protein [Sedimentisphaerales bacterium]|nr:type II secretion system protein [Sedimentisphaerales bacterium]
MDNILHSKRKGFSLAEAMMATVVLGIAAAGVLLPFTAGAAARAEGGRRSLASGLAAELVEQIIRTDFDAIITNYGGYVEAEGHVKDAGGVEFADSRYAKLSRSASCEYVYLPEESGAADPRFILVTVRVCYNGKEIEKVDRLVSQ